LSCCKSNCHWGYQYIAMSKWDWTVKQIVAILLNCRFLVSSCDVWHFYPNSLCFSQLVLGSPQGNNDPFWTHCIIDRPFSYSSSVFRCLTLVLAVNFTVYCKLYCYRVFWREMLMFVGRECDDSRSSVFTVAMRVAVSNVFFKSDSFQSFNKRSQFYGSFVFVWHNRHSATKAETSKSVNNETMTASYKHTDRQTDRQIYNININPIKTSNSSKTIVLQRVI